MRNYRAARKRISGALSFAVASAVVGGSSFMAAQEAAAAAMPIKALLTSKLSATAPAGANALRISIFGDGSGARVQVRLLAPGEDGVLTGFHAAPEMTVDWKGWKTVTLPFSEFNFRSDVDPSAALDGFSSKDTLPNSTGLQLAVTSGDTDLFVDDLGWTTDSAAPTDAPLAVIDSFDESGALNGYKAAGDYEQLRALRFNRSTKTAKSGGALEIVVRTRGFEEQSRRPGVDAFLKRAASPGYAISIPALFDNVTSEAVPTLNEAKAAPKLSLFASGEEVEPATFTVYTAKALKNATVKMAAPLTSAAKKVIPNAAVNIRVVRVAPVESGPQLLMKDDRESLTGPLPTVRLTGDPVTDIAVGTSKQFWITVRVPRNQTPGLYTGKVVFSAAGVKSTTMPFTVEVLPLALKTAFLQYGIDLPSRLADADTQSGEVLVTPELLTSQLTNIRDHNFRMVTLHDRPGGSLESALSLYKQAGLSPNGPVIVAAPLSDAGAVTALENLRGTLGGLELFYQLPASGPDAETYAAQVAAANRSAKLTHSVGAVSEYGTLTQALNDASGERLAPIYSLSSDYVQKLLATGKRNTPNRDYWTWDISQQSPLRNRLFAGMLLYKTGPGLYGAFPGPYQYVPSGVDPYTLFNPQRDPATPRPSIVAYPVQGGVLDTLQWEAVREGIDDIRYIGVLKSLSRELKDLKMRKDATDIAESYVLGVSRKDLLILPPDQQHLHRRNIINQAIKLQKLLPKGRP